MPFFNVDNDHARLLSEIELVLIHYSVRPENGKTWSKRVHASLLVLEVELRVKLFSNK
mgnify:FL=1